MGLLSTVTSESPIAHRIFKNFFHVLYKFMEKLNVRYETHELIIKYR